jgi:hypothetical protein
LRVETQSQALQTLRRGYVNFFRGLSAVIAGAAILVATGAAIVYPLWLFATKSPFGYTIVVLVAFAAGLVFLALRWFRREAAQHGVIRPLQELAASAIRVLAVAALVIGVYIDVLLFQVGQIGFAVPLTLALLAILGLLFSGIRGGGDKRSRNGT